ncbi:MAG: hypothetical protein R3D71_08060 [Rickettsiales bacterium]
MQHMVAFSNANAGTYLRVTTGFIEQHSVDSQEFAGVVKHEIGHSYDYVNNGNKEVVYNFRQHMKDKNPKLYNALDNILAKYNVSDDEFNEAATREHPILYIINDLELSAEEKKEIMGLWNPSKNIISYLFSSNEKNFREEFFIIKEKISKIKGAINHQKEFRADMYAVILESVSGDPSLSNTLNNIKNKYMEEHSHSHPNTLYRIDFMDKIMDLYSSGNIAVEELMNLPTPSVPMKVLQFPDQIKEPARH